MFFLHFYFQIPKWKQQTDTDFLAEIRTKTRVVVIVAKIQSTPEHHARTRTHIRQPPANNRAIRAITKCVLATHGYPKPIRPSLVSRINSFIVVVECL